MDISTAMLLLLVLPCLIAFIFFLLSSVRSNREMESQRQPRRHFWEVETLDQMKKLYQWLAMRPTVEMPDDLVLLSRHLLTHAITAARVNQWATACVTRGLDSPTLCSLATVTEKDDPQDLAEKLEKGLSELGLARPDEATARLYRGLALVDRILTGEVAPRAGLEELIQATAYAANGYRDPFADFEELHDRMVAGPPQGLDYEIRCAAQQLVELRERAHQAISVSEGTVAQASTS